MADLKVEPRCVLTLQPAELRLIGLALAGKLRPQEVNQARELNARIMEQRAKQLGSIADLAEDAADKARTEAHNAPRTEGE